MGAVLGGTLDVSTLLPSLCLRTVFRFLSPNCTVKNEQQQKAASPCHNITGTAVIPFGIELIAGFAGRDIKAHTIAVFYCTTSHMIFGIRRGGWEGRGWGTGGGGGAKLPSDDDDEVLLYVHRNRRFIRDGSPGRPPRLSHRCLQAIYLVFKVLSSVSGYLRVNMQALSQVNNTR